MIKVPQTPFIRRRSHILPPAPAALVLESAVYNWGSNWVRLTFDRAVDIAGIDVSAVSVQNRIDTETTYSGTGTATAVSAVTVQVPLTPTGPSSIGVTNLLTVTAANGIIADDDGGTWPGVTDDVV
jgi:hypothetical protein